MRMISVALAITALLATALAFFYRQEPLDKNQRIADLGAQMKRQLSEIEQNTRQRIDNENRI